MNDPMRSIDRYGRGLGRAALAGALVLAWAVPMAALAGEARAPWKRHTIDESSRGADGVRLADVNGDGRQDIATGWEQGGITRVYVNPGPAKASQTWPAVTVGKSGNVEDAVLVDLDGDGASDVVTCCEGGTKSVFIHWAPKKAPGRPDIYMDPDAWKTEPLPASEKVMAWMYALPMQIDGAHGVDLVAAGKGAGAKVGWFEAPADPRDLKAWKWHPLIDATWIMSLVAADMDGDGDADVVVSERKGKQTGCYWLEKPDDAAALAKPWRQHWIGSRGRQVMFICLADLDGDGLTDVLASVKDRDVVFHRRLSADGKKWREHRITAPENTGTAKACNVGDIDADGKLDIVFTCESASGQRSGVMWLSAVKAVTEAQWQAHEVSGPEGVKYDLVELIDLDGDGDLDVLTCEESANLGVFWYENPLRAGTRQ